MGISKIKINDQVKWEVRLRVYEDGKNPRRIKRVFDRRTEAEGFIQSQQEDQKKAELSPFKDCSLDNRYFSEEAEFWLKDGSLRFSASHLVRVRGILKEILPVYGQLRVAKLTPGFISAFQQQEAARGLQNATINRKTEVINGVLNFSAKQKRIPFNPAIGFKKLAKSQTEMLFWNVSEARSFLSHANDKYPPDSKDRWIYIVYLVALNTALRAGEIWGLMPMDLNSTKTSLLIKRQFSRVTLDFAVTKSKKIRTVPCNDEIRAELNRHISSKGIRSHQALFQNEDGNPICHENFVKRKFENDIENWGGRRIRFHDLRHTAITLMIATGKIDMKTVKEIAGHANIETTMGYAHLVPGSIERVASTFSLSWDKETTD